MFGKIGLVLSGGVLMSCWIGTLYGNARFRGGFYIDVETEALFIGLSILLGAVLLALVMAFRSGGDDDRVAADYVAFCEGLAEGEKSRDDLEAAVGRTFKQTLGPGGEYESVNRLTRGQARSLDRLVYEGKIHQQGDRYRLP